MWHKISYIRHNHSYALHNMDNELIHIFDRKLNGFFVELGANNGITQSNTYKLERKYGWTGILIEPTLDNFIKCVNNRSSHNTYENCVCVSFSYSTPTMNLTYSNLMTIGSTSPISHRDHLQRGKRFINPLSHVPIIVPVKTLTKIFQEVHAPQHIDLLSLDVEGAELDVLQGIDYEKYSFSYLLIECWDFEKIRDYLAMWGYKPLKQLSEKDWVFSQKV